MANKVKVTFKAKNDQSYRPGYAEAFRALFFRKKVINTELAPDGVEKLKTYGISLDDDIFDPVTLFCIIYGLRKRTVNAWCDENDKKYSREFASVFEECHGVDWLKSGKRLMSRDKDDKFDDRLFEKRQWWVYKKDIRLPKEEENTNPTVLFPIEAIKQALDEGK